MRGSVPCYDQRVALGEIAKQVAKEALGNQMKSVVDSLRPADLAGISDSIADSRPASGGPASSVAATIAAEVQAMQKALKESEELVIVCATSVTTLRILDIYVPSPDLLVLTGIDPDKTVTRIIAAAATIQLACKPMPVLSGAKPVRVRVILPKTKPE